MKTDKISFGTKPLISDFSALAGLPKYKPALTEGILDAFEKMGKNQKDGELAVEFGLKKTSKSTYSDILELSYFERKDKNTVSLKSRLSLNPAKMENLSAKKISNIITKAYEKLTKTDKKSEIIAPLPFSKEKVTLPEAHKEALNTLLDTFGCDGNSNF